MNNLDKIIQRSKKQPRSNHAFLAQTTYVDDPNERNRLASTRGFSYDADLSDLRHGIYNANGLAYVVFRGTKDSKDVLDDIKIMARNYDISNEKTVAERAIAKYGRGNVRLVGHSLGGYKAKRVAKETGLKGIVFNTYKPLFDENVEGVVELNKPGDLISGDYTTTIQSTLSNHGIENF